MTYKEITNSIEVRVKPKYLVEQSRPEEGLYVWAYDVEIANNSLDVVQLRNRYWRILNSSGQSLEVRGPGVVGEEPTIQPGGRFSYSSYTNLATPSGLMMGSYQMERPSGERFDITIPAFSLDSPAQLSMPN